jgi:hypothetical protein
MKVRHALIFSSLIPFGNCFFSIACGATIDEEAAEGTVLLLSFAKSFSFVEIEEGALRVCTNFSLNTTLHGFFFSASDVCTDGEEGAVLPRSLFG